LIFNELLFGKLWGLREILIGKHYGCVKWDVDVVFSVMELVTPYYVAWKQCDQRKMGLISTCNTR
jgi:hypothetical protein